MKKWIVSGFIYLILISLIGILLRLKIFAPVLPEVPFMYLVHAHSHVAFLGWVYFILTACLIQFTMPSSIWSKKKLHILFILLHISVIGMFVSFSLQGYKMFSILFSSSHIFLSYYFAYLYFSNQAQSLSPTVKRLLHTGVILNLISSLGPWGLAATAMTGKSTPALFDLYIYFYLHFQYNGWFSFIILGLSYLWMEKQGIPFSTDWTRRQFYILLVSVFPTYITSIMWYPLPRFMEVIGVAGGILQFLAIVIFLFQVRSWIATQTNKWLKLLLLLFTFSLGVKSSLEMLGTWPQVAQLVYTNRQVIIAYLHLTLLGSVTSFLFYTVFNLAKKRLHDSKLFGASTTLYLIGTVSMVFLLFLGGLFHWLTIPIPLWLWSMLLLTSVVIGLGVIGLSLILR